MIRKLLFIAFVLICFHNVLNAQVVYFNGLGRALVTNDRIKGVALDPDSAGARTDTTNPRKGTGGYTLFDLGINAQPNEMLRAHAILRIKNDFGGFYGDGSFLVFRQLRLDGVLAKVFKYEIGDVDLSLTPYTLYNFDEMYNDYEADVFAIRRSIVHYENFNFGNKWRLQGFNGSAAFQYEKYIEKVGVKAFATRTKRTDLLASPDRLLTGGRVDLKQSRFLTVGANYANFFDVTSLAPSITENYNNKVFTGDIVGTVSIADSLEFKAFAEFGQSNYSYDISGLRVSNSENSGFYDAGLSAEYKPLGIKLTGSFREVQTEFRSPGAQTRRIWDETQAGLFGTVGNNGISRTAMMFDRFTQEEGIRNHTLNPFLMPFLPQYNNITPYGIATPNRRGLTLTAAVGDDDQLIRASATADLLSEVAAEGADNTAAGRRNFLGVKGGGVFRLNKLLGWEKVLSFNGGLRYEKTTRDLNPVDFESFLWDAGVTAEVLKGFDLIAGYKLLTAKGNEFLSNRDPFTRIVTYRTYNININESIIALGVRYRFSKNSYFTLQGHFTAFENNQNKYGTDVENNLPGNYQINQAFLNYTMIF